MTPPKKNAASTLAAKRGPLLEVACILALFCAPALASAGTAAFFPGSGQRTGSPDTGPGARSIAAFDAATFKSIVFTLRLVPVLLLAARGPGGLRARAGLGVPKPAVDLALGAATWFVVAAAGALLEQLAGRNAWWIRLPAPLPVGTAILVGCECVAVGFLEEVGMRAWLINRIEALGVPSSAAIAFSAVAFGVAHSYKGVEGIAASAIAGAVWGIAFCATRRVWPVAFSHALLDFMLETHLAALAR